MNSRTDEGGVKYVLTVSQPNKKVCLKKVNIKDIPPSALGRVIRCKQISSLKLPQEQKAKTDEVELTVVPSSTANASLNEASESPTKKIKIEDANQSEGDEQTVAYENEDDFDDDEDDDIYDDHVFSSSEKQIRNHSKMFLKQDDYNYIPPGSYKAKRTSTADSEKRKVKPKLFRSEWLNIDIFRDWLDRDPNNPYKARCIACDCIINAGKSELEKHAVGLKHAQALEKMQQELLMSQLEESNEDALNADGSQEGSNAQPMLFGEDLQSELYHVRLQHVDALNRVATAVETLTATAVGLLEKMASTQEGLVHVIQQLQNK